MQTSLQLWSLRDEIGARGFGPVVKDVATMGYRNVEPFALGHTIDEVEPAVRAAGLSVPTVHGDVVTDDLDALFDAAGRLGATTVVQARFDPDRWVDAEALDETADLLERAARVARDRGMRVAVHHHDDELELEVEGRSALLALCDRLSPDIGIQVDVNWAALSGVDPVDLVRTLGDRVLTVHVKDGPGRGENTEQLALGRGKLPLDGFLAALPATAVVVVSLDQYRGDALEAVAASRTWLDGRGMP